MLTILSAFVSLLSFRVRSRASLELELVAPWQNAYVERLIGSIRRECLDHMIVFGEAHLRRILGAYAAYYNESRTHRSLNKDAPFHRAIERLGTITSHPILGGLHHQYCRI
jgi:transposase InsO family protein